MKRFTATTAITTILLISAASALAQETPPGAALSAVKTIALQTNGCTPQLSTELQKTAGHTLTSDTKTADAVMTVDVHQLDANTGASARFSAVLRNQAGKEVFSTTGREDSISQEELCEDIAEETAERMVERRAVIR